MIRGRGRNKYGAKKTACQHGHTHASAREAKRCNDLHLLQRAGEIEDLRQQPKFFFVINGQPLKHRNGHKAKFTPDFAYREIKTGAEVVEDSKGYIVRDYPLRRALFCALFPTIDFREV